MTGSKWDEGEMKPFTLGFLCFLFLTFSPLQWLWRRDVDAELSGAEDLRYQEAYDESDGLMAQFRPRSAEAEAAAAQAQAEAQAAEAEAEAEVESGVDGSSAASAASARATGLRQRRASREAAPPPKSASPARQLSARIRHSLVPPSLSSRLGLGLGLLLGFGFGFGLGLGFGLG